MLFATLLVSKDALDNFHHKAEEFAMNTTIVDLYDVINESNIEHMFRKWMDAIQQDPIRAATEFRDKLKRSARPNKRTLETVRQLDNIIQGDRDAWQYGSKSITDAVHFVISNTLMRHPDIGLGVLHVGARESIEQLGATINEEMQVYTMNDLQIRLRKIANSYGFDLVPIQVQ